MVVNGHVLELLFLTDVCQFDPNALWISFLKGHVGRSNLGNPFSWIFCFYLIVTSIINSLLYFTFPFFLTSESICCHTLQNFRVSIFPWADYLVDEGTECNSTSDLLLERNREQTLLDLLIPCLVLLINLLQKLKVCSDYFRGESTCCYIFKLFPPVLVFKCLRIISSVPHRNLVDLPRHCCIYVFKQGHLHPS